MKRALYKATIGGIIIEIVFFILLALVNLIPIFWGFLTSIKSANDINRIPPVIVGFRPVISHYRQVIASGFFRSCLNSLFYCCMTIVMTTIFSYLAGYGFARRSFPLKKFFFFMVIVGIPLSGGASTLLIPNYMSMTKLGMINHWYTMPCIFTAFHLSTSVWMMIAGVKSIPVELEEAAKIDGVGQGYIMTRLLPPLMLPSYAAAALLTFIGVWNDYITSSVMVSRSDLKTVQQLIYEFMGFYGRDYGPLMASSMLAIVPIIIVFVLFGRQLISGLTAGAVKG
jgi:multiple sugar transport system permease protein